MVFGLWLQKIVAERQAKITQNDLGDFVAHSSEVSGFRMSSSGAAHMHYR